MATFKALIRPEQQKSDGSYNVKIRVTHNRKTKYISTPFFVNGKEIVKRKKDGKEDVRIKNQSVLDKTDEIILGYKRKIVQFGMSIDAWDVDKLMANLNASTETFKLDFIGYGNDYVARLMENGKESTGKAYQVALNALRRFVGRDDLDISEITVKFLQAFEKFLKEEPKLTGSHRRNKPPKHKEKGRSMPSYLAKIKTIHAAAKLEYNDEERGIINIPYSPFSRYKVPAVGRSEHRVLTVGQIQRIIDLPYKKETLKGFSMYNIAKDVFLLSFALMGMNLADVFEAEPIRDDILAYKRKKTRTRRNDEAEIKVRIEPQIKPLVAKYRGISKAFLFGEHYTQKSVLDRVVNRGLKLVGEDIGVSNLTYYYARHTMASICANKLGIDIARVDEMLNHSDPKLALARVYIEKDFKPLWEANKRLLDLFDWSFYNKEAEE
jgi:integrase